jgi:5-methyltetrahydropteroyltriglutamate--homocysteine methyltransferase
MRRSDGRIRTTHTGSLPRRGPLLSLIVERELGNPYDEARMESVVREETARVVHGQVEVGLDVVNDGEQGKNSFQGYRYARLSGFELVDASPRPAPMEARDFPEYFERWSVLWRRIGEPEVAPSGPVKALACTGPIGWKDFGQVERDIANLRTAADEAGADEVFMTAVSPGTYAPPNLYYATEDEYLEALADAMAREYEAIVAAGFVLQVDAPDLTTMYRLRDLTVEEYHRTLGRCVDAINHAIRRIPPDAVRVHVCWGADEAPHTRDVPLPEIVDSLLRLDARGLGIPGANGRHAHEWRVWETADLGDKVLVPGVIDSTTNIVEHPEAVAERVARYVGVVGRERVIAGVDCGFGTSARVPQVDERVMWAKLGALVEGTRLVTA